MKLRLEAGTYPSGKGYVEVFAAQVRLGRYDVTPEGFFLPQGCRTPSSTEREAQLRVVERYAQRHEALAALARSVLREEMKG